MTAPAQQQQLAVTSGQDYTASPGRTINTMLIRPVRCMLELRPQMHILNASTPQTTTKQT